MSSYLVLKELGKEVTIVANDPAPENLGFLPSIDILQNSIGGSADFIISVDTAKIPVGKIKYNVEDQKINIIITPKSGSFSENDVSFVQGEAKFDLVMVLDTGNLEHLGPLYDKYQPALETFSCPSSTVTPVTWAASPPVLSNIEYSYVAYLTEAASSTAFLMSDALAGNAQEADWSHQGEGGNVLWIDGFGVFAVSR